MTVIKKDHAFKTFKSSRFEQDYEVYKRLRNKSQNLIKSAKLAYVRDKIKDESGNSNKLWKTFKNLGTSKTLKTKLSNFGLKIGEAICFQTKEVAQELNKFFTTIAQSLVS